MTDTIFRVEHKTDGGGCYGSTRYGESDLLDAMQDEHNSDLHDHPCPQNDRGILRPINNNEFCGFESMESLNQWFMEEEITELQQCGYEVIELNDVEITAVGEKQVLVIKNAEKILKKEKILLDIAF